jgi:glycine cleavage system regulatory protein
MTKPTTNVLTSRITSYMPAPAFTGSAAYSTTSPLRNLVHFFSTSAPASTSPLTTILSKLSYYPKNHPVLFGMSFSLFKTSFSDLMVQTYLENKPQIDWKRNATFAAFGCFYLGGVQYFIYVPVFSRLFPYTETFSKLSVAQKFKDVKGSLGAAVQVCIDQFIHHPLMYFPVFYAIKEVVTKDSPDVYNAVFVEYRKNMVEDLTALWKLWLPTTCISFYFLPLWLRIPWSATTSLVWTMILSAMRGGSDKITPALEDGEGLALSGATASILFETDWDDAHVDPVDLSPDLLHTTVTISGPDRKGLVKNLSESIYSTGANIAVSKMNRLGSAFVLMMTVSYDGEKVSRKTLEGAIKSAATAGEKGKETKVAFNNLKSRETGARAQFVTGIKIKMVGNDVPGLVMDVSKLTTDLGCNVERLDSYIKCKNADKSVRNFHLHIDCGADREFTENEIKLLRERVLEVKEKYDLQKCDVGILRHKRVELR